MPAEYTNLCTARPHIADFYRVVEGSLLKRVYPKKPQGRRSDGFIYILEGTAHYEFADFSFDVSAGDLMFLSSGSVYSIDVASAEYRFIFANFDFGTDMNIKSTVFRMSNTKGIESMFRRMLEKWRLRKPAAKEECMSILYAVYAEIIRLDGQAYIPSQRIKQLDRAVQFISENFAREDLTTEEIARTADMSESHFRRLFKIAYGLSPIKYINILRIERAKELIRYTNESFSDIATVVGFANLYYFSRMFKKEVGCTPSEFKDEYSEYQKM